MKLVSFVHLDGPTRVGAVVEDNHSQRVCDLATASTAYRATQASGGFLLPSTMVEFLQTGDQGLQLARAVLAWAEATGYPMAPLQDVRLLAPVPQPPKLLALAGNYQDHIAEGSGSRVDKNTATPQLFIKPSTTVAGPHQPLALPTRVSKTVDWEIELGVVIGRRAKYVTAGEALDFVAGYTIFNDISSRSLEITKSRATKSPREAFFDWLNGKWQDGSAAMGPYLATRDEVPDPQALRMELTVNDRTHQKGSTEAMIYSVGETVAWASQLCTLEPGDVIATGTPSGVGATSNTFLKPGDVIRASIEGLGTLTTPVVAEA